MNIFFLHMIPSVCAQMHCSKHVIKMILETCQLLCSAWHVSDPEHNLYTPCYKLTHKNHPSAVWTRESQANYKWLCELGLELCNEYTYRYGKVHKCQEYIENLYKNIPPIPDIELTKCPQAMPDTYKDKDVVSAYRHYYLFEKYRMHDWNGKTSNREVPYWIREFHNMFLFTPLNI